MNIVDTNVLVYAIYEESAHHETAKQWWEAALSGNEDVGLPWLVLLGFLRLTTKRQAFSHPISVKKALEFIQEWLEQPSVSVIHPGPRHLSLLQGLLMQAGTGGNLTSDAHLAALAIENHAELISFDHDFARFPGLRWRNPDSNPDR